MGLLRRLTSPHLVPLAGKPPSLRNLHTRSTAEGHARNSRVTTPAAPPGRGAQCTVLGVPRNRSQPSQVRSWVPRRGCLCVNQGGQLVPCFLPRPVSYHKGKPVGNVMSPETQGPKRQEARFRRARASRTEDTAPDLSTLLSQMCTSEPSGDPGPPRHSAGGCPWPLTFVTA